METQSINIVTGSQATQVIILDPAIDPSIERRTKDFLNQLNSGAGKPMEQMTPAEARQVLVGAQKSVEADLSGINVMEKTINQDGMTLKLFVVRPSGTQGKLPAFMFFHGGGWVIGDFETHQRLIRDLVVQSGVVAVYVDYSRSPEAQYPVAIKEAYAATIWVSENGEEIDIDGTRLAVVGNSAGGNLAAVTALQALHNNGPEIKLQVLFWPVINDSFDSLSYQQFATKRFLTQNMMKWFWDQYIPDVEDRRQIYASPLKASINELKGLPPALVQTAENDVLRDEGEAYARKMDEAGVPVTLVRYQGLIHDYGLLNPLADVPAVQSALLQAAAELKKMLIV